jgi:Ca2+-binding RTX toxin-like protein
MGVIDDEVMVATPAEPEAPANDEAPPPSVTYSWDFDYGLGPWTTWFTPSVVTEAGGEIEQFTRLHAAGPLDANHIDGIGALWLVAHLSAPTLGSPGALNLHDAEFQMTVRGTDFEANGGKLALWVCRYVPETGLMENFYVGLQVTNWANTGGDMAGLVTDDWTTITLKISDDPADWTYAGNYQSAEGDLADRYMPFDLQESLSRVDATLHLVMLNPDPDSPPSGFLDMANITVRTQAPAVPVGVGGSNPEIHHGLEDQVATGTLNGAAGIDMDHATFSLISESATNGVATIDPETGAFTFTPPANWYGPTYNQGYATFRYTVSDGVNTSAPITVVVYIGGINDAPELTTRVEDADLIAGQPFNFTLFQGSDIDGDQLTFEVVGDSVVGGTLQLDPHTGRYTFTPTEGFTGQASFRYVMSDGQASSAEKTVTLTVHPAGSPPPVMTFNDAVDFLIAGNLEQWQYWVARLADTDPNAAYHYATWLNDGINGIASDWTLARHYFEQALGASPDVNLRLATLYAGGMGGERDYAAARAMLEALPNDSVAVFRLAILNDLGFGGPVDKALAVEGYMQATRMGNMEAAWNLGRRYLAGEGVAASPEDAYFWIGVAVKFNAARNETVRNLLVYNMSLAAQALTPEQVAQLDAAVAGWTVGDPSPVNDAPVFTGEDTIVPPAVDGGPVTGSLADATDSDGDHLTWVLVDGSAVNGTVTIDPATGAFVFVPAPGYTGPASFSYVVSDGQTATAPRTVTFPVEASTVAVPDSQSTNENQTLTISAAEGLLANDSAGGDATLAVTAVNGVNASVGQPVVGAWGVLVVQADGSYVFAPSAEALTLLQGQTATDTFTYTMTDSEGVSVGASLTITINGLDGIVRTGSGVMIGSALGDVLTGSAGYDVLIGLDGDDRLIGGHGLPDELYGGRGDDTYVVDTIGDSIVELDGEGFDTVETAANAYILPVYVEALVFTGTGDFFGTGNAGDNVITGGAGADVLMGLDGNDILRGGAGLNVLHGGAGDDVYVVETATDQLIELSGGGIDTVLTGLSSYTLASPNVENLTYSGTGAFTGTGDAGANVITGGAGDDVLAGRGGNDTLIGGDGIDTASYADAAGAVDVRLNGRVALRDGDGGTDILSGIENLIGSAFDDLLVGDAGANILRGGLGRDILLGMDGDDVLDGGAGLANTMQGGRGDDLYIVSAVGDSTYELAGEGYDTVQTALGSLRLAENVEALTYTGAGSFFGQGNSGANVIRGGANRDTLMGHGGDDILIGGDGAADELYGGTGDDIYVITAGGDTIIEYAGEGFDTVQTTLSAYTLRLNVEALTYIGAGDFTGTGTSEDNVITGGVGNDVLAGRGGDDVLIGGAGIDTASYANAVAGVDVRLNVGRAIRDGDGGTDTLSGIENLTGSAFDDLLVGDNGDNVLTGGLGRDTLLGMGGNDTLIGGAGVANQLQGGVGDDTYILTVADTVIELAGEGIDTVITATLASYTLGANVENLTYTGTGNFAGSGNGLDNVITGGSGNDTLKGGGGDDILIGGAGTDLALLTGLKDDYLIEQIDGGWRVTDQTAGRDGVDLLYGIETLRFGDGQTLSLTAPAAAASVLFVDKDAGPHVLPADTTAPGFVHGWPGDEGWDVLI